MEVPEDSCTDLPWKFQQGISNRKVPGTFQRGETIKKFPALRFQEFSKRFSRREVARTFMKRCSTEVAEGRFRQGGNRREVIAGGFNEDSRSFQGGSSRRFHSDFSGEVPARRFQQEGSTYVPARRFPVMFQEGSNKEGAVCRFKKPSIMDVSRSMSLTTNKRHNN